MTDRRSESLSEAATYRSEVPVCARLDPTTIKTVYADMVIESWRLFDRLQQKGVIPAGIKFQISLPTADMPALIPVLTTHLPSQVAAIAQALAQHRAAMGRRADACQYLGSER